MNTDFVSDLARRLAANVPGGVRAAQADLERNFEALLQGAFSRLDLVTREEFEIQRRVLERTREKLAHLEADLARLDGAGSQG
jgi:BMFP domain-containing protein YqiC